MELMSLAEASKTNWWTSLLAHSSGRSVLVFCRQRHINSLEMKSVLRLAERLVKAPRPMRVVNFVDSNVVRCAVSKGRSSSRALNPTLQKFGATVLARGLYFTLPFLPTRLNTAEDPTRDREVRGPSSDVAFDDFSAEDMRNLALLPYMRRWISNWARITLVLSGFRLLFFCNGDRRSYGFEWHCFGTHMPKELATDPQLQPDHRFFEFDQMLDFRAKALSTNQF